MDHLVQTVNLEFIVYNTLKKRGENKAFPNPIFKKIKK